MPTATKRKPVRRSSRPTLRGLSQEVTRLRERVEELEDLRDLDAAVARNRGTPGVPWNKAKAALGLD
jgi:hypothetical protein